MTTVTTTTTQRAKATSDIAASGWWLGAALAAFGNALAAWSARRHEEPIGARLEGMAASRRLDAALRWHAGHRRVL